MRSKQAKMKDVLQEFEDEINILIKNCKDSLWNEFIIYDAEAEKEIKLDQEKYLKLIRSQIEIALKKCSVMMLKNKIISKSLKKIDEFEYKLVIDRNNLIELEENDYEDLRLMILTVPSLLAENLVEKQSEKISADGEVALTRIQNEVLMKDAKRGRSMSGRPISKKD